MMKVIITVSPGNSGGGAVHDFIYQNTEFKSPFKGHEFRLITDPDGIINIHRNFFRNYSLNNSIDALERFKQYTNAFSKLKMKVGKEKKEIFNKNFLILRDDYLKKIIKTSYSALPQFHYLKLDFKKKFFLNIKSKFYNKNKNRLNETFVPIFYDEKKFIIETKIFLKKLIKTHTIKNNKIILDQSISIWNLDEIFKYFEDIKIILVTRDPRSIFYSMKSRSSNSYPGHNIKKFVTWYTFIMKKFEKNFKQTKYKKKILKINFEDFVSNKSTKKKILNFINAKEINNIFNFEKSKNNAFKAKKLLNKNHQEYIKKNLKKNLQW